MRLATECMGTAANPAKGGFVREALINQYPKLAALLEDTLHKIRRDTEVPFRLLWRKHAADCTTAGNATVTLGDATHGTHICSALVCMEKRLCTGKEISMSVGSGCSARGTIRKWIKRHFRCFAGEGRAAGSVACAAGGPPSRRRRRSKTRTWRGRCSACRTPSAPPSPAATARCPPPRTCRSA